MEQDPAALKISKDITDPLIKKITAVVYKTMLALEVRPTLLESGSLVRKEKKHGDKVIKPELWSPNVIGRTYRLINTSDPAKQGLSKRMHWRRGHYRHQDIGLRSAPQRADYKAGVINAQKMIELGLIKKIWIEPCLINAPE